MPVNYQLPNPTQAITQGLQIGGALNQAEDQRIQQEQAAQTQQAMREDLATVLNKSPTAADYAALTVKYPQFNEQFKQAWDMLNEDQQSNRINQTSEVYAALEAGKPEIAQRLLDTQARASENSGDLRSAKAARTMSELISESPGTAKTSIALRLASMTGPEKFTETFTKLQTERREASLEPSALSKAEANAKKAAVGAKFAESKVASDLQKTGWDIAKIQNDIKVSKENQKIAAINAKLTRETNELKRDEMKVKLAEFEQKRDQAVRDRVADVESANSNIDNMLNTADRILATSIGTIEDATGPISARLPTLSQDVADFESLIENFDAQAFLAQIPNLKGLGALSDAEGKKVTAALQNFNLKQSPARLMANVREASRLLLKARTNIAQRHGAPETIPDTPAATGTAPGEIDALVNKYSGGG